MTTPTTITSEVQKLEPSAIIELFDLDLTAIGGTDVLRFHAGTNGLSQPIIWQGNTYAPFPIQASGFECTGQGQLPRPKIVAANVTGAITFLILTYQDMLGAKVTRRRTLAKYLDRENFEVSNGYSLQLNFTASPFLAGETLNLNFATNTFKSWTKTADEEYFVDVYDKNPTADPTAEFPLDIYFIDKKNSETKDAVEFELAAAVDLAGVQLPRRQIIQNVCVWKYKGTECGYSGTSYFDSNDAVVASSASDVCGKRLSSCKARFGANNPLPFGSFPAAGLVRS